MEGDQFAAAFVDVKGNEIGFTKIRRSPSPQVFCFGSKPVAPGDEEQNR
jgi:hypothetical protein